MTWDVLTEEDYADRVDRESMSSPELDRRMSEYVTWRKLFDGRYLDEKLENAEADPDTGEKPLRWPLKINIVKTYCTTHAAALWGRGQTANEADDLFDVHVDPDVPGYKPHSSLAPDYQDTLQYFWHHFMHTFRPSGATQQWAGGCILKASWNPSSPNHLWGIEIETPEPESFYPMWDPLNPDAMLGAYLKFRVSKEVAREKYHVEPADTDDEADILVTEYWDRNRWYVKVGDQYGRTMTYNPNSKVRSYTPMQGDNPWVHPLTGQGIIPIEYIPRMRTTGFFGDSLAKELEYLMREINKNYADVGDALAGSSHVRAAVADFRGTQKRLGFGKTNAMAVIPLPVQGIVDLGETPVGKQQARLFTVPPPEVPAQTPAMMDRIEAQAEMVAGLTPAGMGRDSSATSGLQVAMQLLPTTYIIDWTRSHWSKGLYRLSNCVGTMLHVKGRDLSFIPKIDEGAFRLRHRYKYRSAIPRDKLQAVQEVVQLASAKVLPLKELMKRLGDIEKVEDVLGELYYELQYLAAIDAVVAGHSVKLNQRFNTENPEKPPLPTAEVQAPKESTRKETTK